MLLVSSRASQNITTHNNICIKAFLVRSVYDLFSAVTHFQGKINLDRLVLYMLFIVSFNHSLKKSQIKTKHVESKQKSLQLQEVFCHAA